MNEPVDIRVIKGRQRAEDQRRLATGEVTPEELQRENSFIWSAADILYVDLTPKGTEESWRGSFTISNKARTVSDAAPAARHGGPSVHHCRRARREFLG